MIGSLIGGIIGKVAGGILGGAKKSSSSGSGNIFQKLLDPLGVMKGLTGTAGQASSGGQNLASTSIFSLLGQ